MSDTCLQALSVTDQGAGKERSAVSFAKLTRDNIGTHLLQNLPPASLSTPFPGIQRESRWRPISVRRAMARVAVRNVTASAHSANRRAMGGPILGASAPIATTSAYAQRAEARGKRQWSHFRTSDAPRDQDLGANPGGEQLRCLRWLWPSVSAQIASVQTWTEGLLRR